MRLRRVLGRYPTGVVVIAAMSDGEPHGFTVNSFTSVSLDPPIVGFCAAHTSTTWPRIRDAGAFTISVLGVGQADVCRSFSAKGSDRFAGVEWSAPDGGHPAIGGALAWLDCVMSVCHVVGDHELILASVVAMTTNEVDDDPLVFHGGRLGRMCAESLAAAPAGRGCHPGW
ncbi:flavin reductase family protein [Sphaerisporangium melleum]|uniref:flavin reductase family protein n=1 Tax=Sphaerisporangium melleum TaxID=321316 RepID=UPI001E2ECC8A|nr:flavin reductase family protein [Sphaerisporangium melleum]